MSLIFSRVVIRLLVIIAVVMLFLQTVLLQGTRSLSPVQRLFCSGLAFQRFEAERHKAGPLAWQFRTHVEAAPCILLFTAAFVVHFAQHLCPELGAIGKQHTFKGFSPRKQGQRVPNYC